jgi:hypothetical protein
LIILQVIYEHGEPRWNDIDRLKLLISLPELSGNYTGRDIWQKAGGMGERNDNLPCEVFLFIVASVSLHAIKSYHMGPPALFPFRRNMCCGLLSPLKIHRLGRV